MPEQDILDKSLKAIDEMFDDMCPKEFERQYKQLQNHGNGETIESFLARNQNRKDGEPLTFINPNTQLLNQEETTEQKGRCAATQTLTNK